jgi:hypothetical protein
MSHSVINDDAIQTCPIPLPTPPLLGAFGLSLDIFSSVRRREWLPTSWTPRTRANSKRAAALTPRKMRLNLRRDALVWNHVDTLWNLPTVKQSRETASVTIGIGGIIEAIVDEVISELPLAMLTIASVVLSCHSLLMPDA